MLYENLVAQEKSQSIQWPEARPPKKGMANLDITVVHGGKYRFHSRTLSYGERGS
jgi:hypothetical protein